MSDYETKVNADGIPKRVQQAQEWTDSVMGAWEEEEALENIFNEELGPYPNNETYGGEGGGEQMYPEEEAVDESGYKVFGDDTIWDPGFVEDVNYWMNEWAMPILGFGGGVGTGAKVGRNILSKSRTKGYTQGFRKGMQSEFARNASKKAMDNLKSTLKGFEPNTIAWKKGLEEWLKKNPQYRKSVEESMKWSNEFLRKYSGGGQDFASRYGKFDISDILKQRNRSGGVADEVFDFTGPAPKPTKPLAPNEIGIRRYIEDFKAGRVDKWGNPISDPLTKKGFRRFVLNPGTSRRTRTGGGGNVPRLGPGRQMTSQELMDASWSQKINELLERNARMKKITPGTQYRPGGQARLDWQGGRGGSGGFMDLNREIHRKFSGGQNNYRVSNDLIKDIRSITWQTPEHQVLTKVAQLKKKFGIDDDLLGRVFERIQKVRGQDKANQKILSREFSEGYWE